MLTLQIKRWGNSAAVRIPNSVLQQLGWSEGDEIQLEVIDNKLVLSKPGPKISVNPHDFQTLIDGGVDVQAIINDFIAHEALKLK